MSSGQIAKLIVTSSILMMCAWAPVAQAQCVADLNHDATVDGADLSVLLSSWNTSGGAGGGDINDDGVVNASDLALILSAWGACPTPSWATLLEWAPSASIVTNPALRTAITNSGLPWRVRHTASNIEMLLIPAGTFSMGCSAGDTYCSPEELPVHQVTLSHAFYMSKTEVTQGE